MKILSSQPASFRSEKAGLFNRKVGGILLLVILCTLALPAQKQSNIWYFGGKAGLDFSNFHPMPLTDGWFDAPNGVATYCDANGNLLFCSDGRRLWNSAHVLIRPDLTGDPESTHAATFVPSLWNPDELYLFTTKKYQEDDPDNWGGNFYTINLTNPLNPTIIDNSVVTGQGGLMKNSTEKILFIPATFFDDVTGNQKPGYWIIMHEFGTDVFKVFRFWEKGISAFEPQHMGSVHANGPDDDGTNQGGSGQIKANIAGTLLAVAVEGGKFFELFTFDPATGRLGRRRFILPAGEEEFKDQFIHKAYGVEFSPTGNYLYGSTSDMAYVYQWDLSPYNSQELVVKTYQFLFKSTASQGGGMQLASNGKVYVAFQNQPYLGVIHSPLLVHPGCDFQKYGASLVDNESNLGGSSTRGLPSTVPGSLMIPEISFTTNCSNDTIMFFLVDPGTITGNRFWIFKNLTTGKLVPSKAPNNTNQTQLLYPPAGEYQVRCIFYRGRPDTVEIKMHIYEPPNPSLAENDPYKICKGSVIKLDAKDGAFYEWDDRSLKSRYRFIIVDTLKYLLNEIRVEVTDYNGCVGKEIIQLEPAPPPNFTINSTKATCKKSNGSAWVLPDNGDTTKFVYLWEYDSSTRYKLENIPFGAYRVHVWGKTPPYCEVIDTVLVSDFSVQAAEISSVDTTVCPGSRVTLRIVGEVDEFEWINPAGATGREVDVFPTDTTVYTLKITSYDGDNQCYSYVNDTIFVYPVNKPEIADRFVSCEGDTIRIDGGDLYSGWTWSDGFEGQVNPVTQEQPELILFATDVNRCTFTDTTQVHFKPLPAIDLGPDRILCSRDPVTLSGGQGESYEWSTGETTREIRIQNNNQYSLKITSDGCPAFDTVNIRINNPDFLKIDSLLHRDVSCNGSHDGEIRIVPSGQGLTYQYSIDGGVTFGPDSIMGGLSPGDQYRVAILEDSVCRFDHPDPVVINEPTLLTARSCVNPPSCETCSDGNITLSNIAGGTGNYRIRINGEETGSDMQGLGPGLYTVSITDENGCSWSSEINLVAGMNVRIESSDPRPVCPGSPVTLTVVNGGQIEWINPAEGLSSGSVIVKPFETTIYQAVSTNDLGCSIIVNYTVEIIPHTDPSLGEDVSKCEGDIVTLDAGDGYLDYSWNTGETSRSINLVASKDPVIVTVTDSNHCTLSDTVAVYINPYPEVNLGKDKSLCTNTPVELSGGTGEIYLWSTGATTPAIEVDRSGAYSLAITTLGCMASDTVNVKIVNPDLLVIGTPVVTDNTCFGKEFGSIEIVAQGSGGMLGYSIDDGITWQDEPLFEFLLSGDGYRIRVREDELCTSIYPDPVTVKEPDSIFPDVRLRPPTCDLCSDGQIIIKSISGGESPYVITMNGQEQGMTIAGLAFGTYTLVITDAWDCSRSFEYKIDINTVVPNVITPDDKYANNRWTIPLLKYYSDAEVRLFDVKGRLVRQFEKGYPQPWEGDDERGNPVPMGTYYYIIELNDEKNLVLKGFVMVLR